MVVNMLVAQGGLTVIARLGDLPVVRADRRDPRGHGLRGRARRARGRRWSCAGRSTRSAVDPDEVLRAVPAPLVPLGADTRRWRRGWCRCCARRAAARRGAAVPPGRAAVSDAADARDYRRGARPRARRRGRARGPRIRRRAPAAARIALRAVATSRHLRSRHRRRRSWRSRSGPGWPASCLFRLDPSLHAPVGADGVAVSAAIVDLCAGAVRRPKGDRAVNALALRDVTYRIRARPRRRSRCDAESGAGELVVLAGGSGSGKSTLLRAVEWARAAFPRRRVRGTVTVAGWTPRGRGLGRWRRPSGRCSRTPRRRS